MIVPMTVGECDFKVNFRLIPGDTSMFSICFLFVSMSLLFFFWKIPYNSLVCLLYHNDAVKVNFLILKIAVNINNVSDADFYFLFPYINRN